MQITRLHIQNYKSLYDVEIDSLKPLTILVGPNDSGKSALLQTILLIRAVGGSGLGETQAPPFADVVSHDYENDPIRMAFDVVLDNDEHEALYSDIANTSRSRLDWRADAHLRDALDARLFKESAWNLEWRANVPPHVTRVTAKRRDGSPITIFEVEDHRGRPRSVSMTLQDVMNMRANPDQLAGSTRAADPNVQGLSAWILRRWRNALVGVDGARSVADQAEVEMTPSLGADGSNLLNVLLHMRDDTPNVFERLLVVMGKLLVASRDLGFRPQGKMQSLVFRVAGKQLVERLRYKGAGVAQLLVLVTAVLAKDTCIALIEEPELHLHPGAQREFVRWLRELADEGRQFIVSTHSPVFINEARDSAAIVWATKQNGRTKVVLWDQRPEADKDEVTGLLAEFGIQPSDALLYNALLLVEGPSDCNVFRFLAQSAVGEHRPLQLGITHYEGGRGKAVARYLSDNLNDALSPFAQLPVKIVRDRGALAQRDIDSLGQSAKIHVLQRYEVENYLLHPTGVAEHLRRRVERDAPNNARLSLADATEDKVRELLQEAVPACAPLVCIKRSRDRIKECLRRLMTGLDDAENKVIEGVRSGKSSSYVGAWAEALNEVNLPQWDEVVKGERDKCAEQDEAGDTDNAPANLDRIPGSAMLDCVFRRFGLRYEKERDAGRLAECMPTEHWQEGGDGFELRQIVGSLVNPSKEDGETDAG